jgi:DNA-binding transcriptional LysR family regulator
MNVRVEGQLTFSGSSMAVQAAEAGFGLAMTIEDVVRESIAQGRLCAF